MCTLHLKSSVLLGSLEKNWHTYGKPCASFAGVTIAIDTCYEVWDSGIISVPWNFNINELRPQLIKLLASGHAPTSSSSRSPYPEAIRTAGCFSHNLSSRVQCFGSQTQSYLSSMSTAKQVQPTAYCFNSLSVRSSVACQNSGGSVATCIRYSYVPTRQRTCMYAHGSSTYGAVQKAAFMQNTYSKLLRIKLPTRATARMHSTQL